MDTQAQRNTENSNGLKIGFIGQGWIGKPLADDFENRGYDVVRYALETPYVQNRESIAQCDIVFIAVPTPTTKEGFDASIVREVLPLIGNGKSVVIKSTIIPGTTESLQNEFPNIFIFHSPEFLEEITATLDASHPHRNIVGFPKYTQEFREKAEQILAFLPFAPYSAIMHSKDAEFVKYAGNCFLFTKVMYTNMLYDLVTAMDGDWESIKDGFGHDPRIGMSHLEPFHKGGRGAGGNCFIKDFEAFRRMYGTFVTDSYGKNFLEAAAHKNIKLLLQSEKDLELLEGVYGDLSKFQ